MPKITCSLKTSTKKESAQPLATLLPKLSQNDAIQLDEPRDYVKFRGIARDIINELRPVQTIKILSRGSVLKMEIVSQTVDMSAREKKTLAAKKAAWAVVKVALHAVSGGTLIGAQLAAQTTLHALDQDVFHLAKQLLEKGFKAAANEYSSPPYLKAVCVRICPTTGSYYRIKSGFGLFGKSTQFNTPVALSVVATEVAGALSPQDDGYTLLLDNATLTNIADEKATRERAIEWLTERAKAKFGAGGITLSTENSQERERLLTVDASVDPSDDPFDESLF